MASTCLPDDRPHFKRPFSLRTLTDFFLRFLPTRPLPRMPKEHIDTTQWRPAKAHAYAFQKYKRHEAFCCGSLAMEVKRLSGLELNDQIPGIGAQVRALREFMEDFEHMARQYQDILLAVLELERDNLRMRKRLLEIEKASGGFVEARE